MINASYTTREEGIQIDCHQQSRSKAEERLAYLDQSERQTQQLAPTDSGGVRFNTNAEANALRQALNKQ